MSYFVSIFFGTFLLEDVALTSALLLVAQQKMTLASAMSACFLGISIGDMLLYGLGFTIGSWRLAERWAFLKRFRDMSTVTSAAEVLTYSIVICRFVPGTRLPTYLAAGLARYSVAKFFGLTVITVLGWVGLAFALGQSLRSVVAGHWFIAALVLLLAFKVVRTCAVNFSNRWDRRAFMQSWRQYMSFEFWPGTLFYLPIVPHYIFLSLKHGSFFAPFYANPEIENGGIIGESKWDFLQHLEAQSPHTLTSVKLHAEISFADAVQKLKAAGLHHPFILKPDVGQRGYGVRIIRSDAELNQYLLTARFELIAQRLSQFSGEAGVFYVRKPGAESGSIFSITDKRFPTLTGDGATRLGDLILKDRRARIIAATYFARHRHRLDEIVPSGVVVPLSECGNHCQGAIFLNGKNLMSEDLRRSIDAIAHRIPYFHFGRFDIRYRDGESLKMGREFEIVEVNGAGSEATHIWDAQTKLIDAYKTLFTQWCLLFEIGAMVRKSHLREARVNVACLFRESYRVFFRKEPLSVSS